MPLVMPSTWWRLAFAGSVHEPAPQVSEMLCNPVPARPRRCSSCSECSGLGRWCPPSQWASTRNFQATYSYQGGFQAGPSTTKPLHRPAKVNEMRMAASAQLGVPFGDVQEVVRPLLSSEHREGLCWDVGDLTSSGLFSYTLVGQLWVLWQALMLCCRGPLFFYLQSDFVLCEVAYCGCRPASAPFSFSMSEDFSPHRQVLLTWSQSFVSLSGAGVAGCCSPACCMPRSLWPYRPLRPQLSGVYGLFRRGPACLSSSTPRLSSAFGIALRGCGGVGWLNDLSPAGVGVGFRSGPAFGIMAASLLPLRIPWPQLLFCLVSRAGLQLFAQTACPTSALVMVLGVLGLSFAPF